MGGATTYEIRLEGAPDLAVLSAYEGVHVTVDGGGITVCARLPDQAALHGVLEQARRLGLDLVSVRVLQPRGHRAG
jgi:hypothetical protein